MSAKPKKVAKKVAKPKPRGRPSKWSPALGAAICGRLSKGEPLAKICRDEKMPDPSTVRDWTERNECFSLAIARAREEGYDAIALGLRDTARGMGDSTGDVQRDKLIIDLDLKLLSKWDPKRYGDKLDGEKIQVELEVVIGGTRE